MKRTAAVLSMTLLGSLTAEAAEGPTFSKDVAPILVQHCASCHRPGEVGPFSLLSYKDVVKRAEFLKDVTEEKRMPPWKAEAGYGEFHDARTLSAAEIKTIAAWADAGAPEGDPKDLPAMPKFPEGWQLGKPDLILEMPETFTIPASGKDIQRCFVIPVGIDSDKTVAAVEFRPGNRKVVHHSILFLTASGAATAKDKADPGPGYSSFGGIGVIPTGGLGGWAPGAMPRMLPDGTGKLLKAGNDLIMQVHYHPSGKVETDKSTVGVYFTKTPVKKFVAGLAVRSRDIDIPAGDSKYHVEAESAPLPADYQAIGISPHMHNIGREMKVYATTPKGETIPMIWIKDWDFNWQGQYLYSKPIRLPKGSIVKVEANYDNSEANPRNPSNPPKHVKWGEQTTDEMCLLAIQVTADSNADLKLLATLRGNGLGAILVGGPAADRPIGAAMKKAAAMRKNAGTGTGTDFTIPEQFKEQLARFDTNNDGKLSAEEREALPEGARQRIDRAMQNRPGAGKP